MDHGYYRDRISGYLDRELPDYEMEAVRQHLAECAECRGLYEELTRLNGLVQRHSGLDGEEYWEAAALRIERRIGIAEEPEVIAIPPKRGGGFGWKLAAAAASVAVLMFIGLNYREIMRQAETPSKPEVQELRAPTVAEEARPEEPTEATGAVDEDVEVSGEQKAERPTVGASGAGETTLGRQEISAEKVAPAPGAVREEREKAAGREEKSEAAAMEEREAILDKGETKAKPQPQATSEQAANLATGEQAPDQPKEEADIRILETRDRLEPIQKESVRLQAPSLSQGKKITLDADTTTPAASLSLSPKQFSAAGGEGTRALTLADWEIRRDSLQTTWAELRSSHLNLALPKGRRDRAALSDIDLVERQLLEAQFQIGKLAAPADSVTRAEAVSFLQEYIERADARYRETARMYLEELGPGSADSVDTSGGRR